VTPRSVFVPRAAAGAERIVERMTSPARMFGRRWPWLVERGVRAMSWLYAWPWDDGPEDAVKHAGVGHAMPARRPQVPVRLDLAATVASRWLRPAADAVVAPAVDAAVRKWDTVPGLSSRRSRRAAARRPPCDSAYDLPPDEADDANEARETCDSIPASEANEAYEGFEASSAAGPVRSHSTPRIEDPGPLATTGFAHMWWADRWLARLAGATPTSLASIAPTSAVPRAQRRPDTALPVVGAARAVPRAEAAPTAASEVGPTADRARLADDIATPDHVLEALVAASQPRRAAQPSAVRSQRAVAAVSRPTLADAIAAAPQASDVAAPASLAASPFAVALRHLLPSPVVVPSAYRHAPVAHAVFVRAPVPLLCANAGVEWGASAATPSAPRPAIVTSGSLPPLSVPAASPSASPSSLPPRSVAVSWTAPGMVAARMRDHAVARALAVTDVACDIATPDLVAAARERNLAVADLVLAARVAIAGANDAFAAARAVEREPSHHDAPAQYHGHALLAGAAAALGIVPRAPRGAVLRPAIAPRATSVPQVDTTDTGSAAIAILELVAGARSTGSQRWSTGSSATDERTDIARLTGDVPSPLFAPSYLVPRASAPDPVAELGRAPVGRHGGGEVEIPPWFATAARTVLERPTNRGDLSIAELALIAAMPRDRIAASSREMPTATPPPASRPPSSSPSPSLAPSPASATPCVDLDIDAIARDVYHQLLANIDARHIRDGALGVMNESVQQRHRAP
jgi:hypothetical protein